MKIFIVEDDYSYRNMLFKLLLGWGYEPMACDDGIEAWRILQQKDAPKFILLDWNLPGITGLELIKNIRNMKDHSPPYIIMVTGKSEKESLVSGLDAGANDYIFKPCQNEVLRARINNGRRMLELQESLEHESSHDPLTGILNRRAIAAVLNKELSRAKRKQEGLIVGFCDLDNFKKINDEHGHQVGDEVLCGFVHMVEDSLRSYDTFGRWGGEEFLLVMPLFSRDDGLPLFERLRNKIAEGSIVTSAGALKITISIGVVFADGHETENEVLEAVDRNMYEAKKAGRNRVCYTETI